MEAERAAHLETKFNSEIVQVSTLSAILPAPRGGFYHSFNFSHNPWTKHSYNSFPFSALLLVNREFCTELKTPPSIVMFSQAFEDF